MGRQIGGGREGMGAVNLFPANGRKNLGEDLIEFPAGIPHTPAGTVPAPAPMALTPMQLGLLALGVYLLFIKK